MPYFFFSLTVLLLPTIVLGQAGVTYKPLIQGGGLETDSLGALINSLYLLSISLAALLATIKLIIAGAKYMLSDVVTTQSDAKNEIQASLLGLLLVISAVLILTIINPAIVSNQFAITRVATTDPIPEATAPRAAGDLRGADGKAVPQEKFTSCTNIQTVCGDSQCDTERPDFKRTSKCILPSDPRDPNMLARREQITAAFKKECEDKGGTYTAGTNPTCTSGTSNPNVKTDPKVKTYNTIGRTGGTTDPNLAAAAKADCDKNFGVYFQETTQGKCQLPKVVHYQTKYKYKGNIMPSKTFVFHCTNTLKGEVSSVGGVLGVGSEDICIIRN